MDFGARAAQLISEVTPQFFITAAQATLQQSNQAPTSVSINSINEAETSKDMTTEQDNTPPASDEENDEEYEVEKILKTKVESRKRYFLVRWKNYGEEYDTWEPQDILAEGAAEIMKEFMDQQKAKNGKKPAATKPANRKRPASTSSSTTRTRTTSQYRDGDEEEASENNASSDEDSFAPGNKKSKTESTKTPRGKGRPNRADHSTPSTTAAPVSNGILSNKRPWFMDSDSDNDKQSDSNENSLPTSPRHTTTTESMNSLRLIIKSPRQPESLSTTTPLKPERNNDDEEDVAEGETSKKEKKDKHKKKDKKSKVKLIYEGVFRRSPGESLSFIARLEGAGGNSIYSLEEAIETDSRSLSRFLADRIIFSPDGVPSIPINSTL